MNIIFELFAESNLKSVAGWIVVTYGAVLCACVVDLFCGLYKAIKSGQATTSTGLRKTCAKAQHYFIPMLCLSFGDVLAAAVVDFAPFTILWGAFCIACEFKSVLEKSSTKQEIREAAQTMSVVIRNKDDLARALVEIMQQAEKEKANTKENEDKPKRTRKNKDL